MFPCRPPFYYSGIGEIVADGSFDFVPQRFVQRAVTIVNEHAFAVSCKSGEERAEPELVWSVKIAKGAHALEKEHCEVAAFLRGPNQIAPLSRQNIDSRAAAFLVLLSDLNSEVNQRRNDTNGRHHLPDRGKHFPV